MTTIRLLQQMSGYRGGVPWPEVGAEMEVDEAEAATLCMGQTPIAERVGGEPEAEDTEKAEKPVTSKAKVTRTTTVP